MPEVLLGTWEICKGQAKIEIWPSVCRVQPSCKPLMYKWKGLSCLLDVGREPSWRCPGPELSSTSIYLPQEGLGRLVLLRISLSAIAQARTTRFMDLPLMFEHPVLMSSLP